MPTQFLDSIPAPALFVALLILFVVTLELGYKLGAKRHRDTEYVDEGRSSQAGVVLGAMFASAQFIPARIAPR